MRTAIPWPPPMHAAPIARLSPLRLKWTQKKLRDCFGLSSLSLVAYFNSCTKWPVIREPLAANGWPRAIAPPFTFNLLISKPSDSAQANVCTLNASLIYEIQKVLFYWSSLSRQSKLGNLNSYFNQINIIQCQSGNFKNVLNGRHWTDTHNFGWNTNSWIGHQSSQRFQITFLYCFFGCQQNWCGTIANTLNSNQINTNVKKIYLKILLK